MGLSPCGGGQWENRGGARSNPGQETPPFEGGAGRAPCLSRKGAGPVDGAMKPVEKAVTALPFRLCSSVTLAGPSWEKVAPMPPASRNPIFPARLGLRVGAGLGAPPLGGESPPPRPPQPSPHSASASPARRAVLASCVCPSDCDTIRAATKGASVLGRGRIDAASA